MRTGMQYAKEVVIVTGEHVKLVVRDNHRIHPSEHSMLRDFGSYDAPMPPS
jgi:hypothetical protein